MAAMQGPPLVLSPTLVSGTMALMVATATMPMTANVKYVAAAQTKQRVGRAAWAQVICEGTCVGDDAESEAT